MKFSRFPLVFTGVVGALLLSVPAFSANSVLWRIGTADNSNREFTGSTLPREYTVAPDWKRKSVWPSWAGGSGGGKGDGPQLETDVRYTLKSVPRYGAEFIIKTSDASALTPELAVFSNGFPCGVIQIAGSGWPGDGGNRFGRSYNLYVPKEFMHSGSNILTLRALGHPYNRASHDFLWFTWDYFQMEALASRAAEPIHSKMTYMGVQDDLFEYNDTQIKCNPLAFQWLGVAYSGNPDRAVFWSDASSQQPKRLEYLRTMRDYNMSVIVDGLSISREMAHSPMHSDGTLPDSAKSYLDMIFQQYGSLFQYYEISNEPCMSISGDAMSADIAVAKYVKSIKPKSVKLAAPGWAYGGGAGTPVDWDADPSNRAKVEQYCDAINGHSYANSYAQQHGSLIENLKVYGNLTNGWPKECINTECGTWEGHNDNYTLNGANLVEARLSQPHASSFDRNLRAHLGFCDRFTEFAFLGMDLPFNFVNGVYGDPSTWTSKPFADAKGEDQRVKIFRRYELAYSTHGKPLTYRYADPNEVKNELVYFRAVDTSALAPLPGSGAVSNKILISFVNFDTVSAHRMHVRVTMPASGQYTGLRWGPEEAFKDAKSNLNVTASPLIDIAEMLGPGEAVEYVLDKPSAAAQYPAKR